ncbi:MAG: ATP-binding protein, partial [Deltaproteobacteria bacterium]|nr:ATP-binding protein [Deltaproteobacteria bacterium]
MYIKRSLASLLNQSPKSILLLGPRQTGKSTLIESLKPDLTINLAHEPTFIEFARNPNELEQRLDLKKMKVIFIDEVQRLPSLLNTVQVLIDQHKKNIKFFLTGSSARKLKRGQANLLPGRILVYHLGPLSAFELHHNIHMPLALETGMLPGIYTEKENNLRQKILKSYCITYLKEEIQAEALTRNLEGFSRFLYTTAAHSGNFLDLSKLSSQAQVPRESAVRYFEILEDTLIVHRCESFSKNARQRLIKHPKFYFFDVGILNALLNNFIASQDRIGLLFEHFFFTQLLSSAWAKDQDIQISTFRTQHGAEVDFIVEFDKKVWAIELKAATSIPSLDTRGFKS